MPKIVEEKILAKLYKLINPGPKQTQAIKDSLEMDLGEGVIGVITSIQKNESLRPDVWLERFYYTKEMPARAFYVHVLIAIFEEQERRDDVQRKRFYAAGGKEGERCAFLTEGDETICAMTPVWNPDYVLNWKEIQELEELKRLHDVVVYVTMSE